MMRVQLVAVLSTAISEALRYSGNRTSNDPCSAARLLVSQSQPECPSMTARSWLDEWTCGEEDVLCSNARRAQESSPDGLLDIITRRHDDGYAPDTARLQQKLAEAAVNSRPLKVFVFGTSFTAGRGCDTRGRRWTDVLEQLSNLAGSPVAVEVLNQGMPGATLRSLLPQLATWQDSPVDLIVFDSTMSDVEVQTEGHGETTNLDIVQSVEDAVAMVGNFSQKPAVLFFETLSINALLELRLGKINVCQISRDPALSPHWEPLKRLRIPSVSFADAACALDGSNVTEPKNGILTYWRYAHDINHPTCDTHSLSAHLFMQYLGSMKHSACSPSHWYLQTAASEVSEEVAKTAVLTETQQCVLHPLTYLSADKGFPANSSSGWRFFEDVTGKPGWIAVPQKLHFKGSRDIVFDVYLHSGIVMISYLSSYKQTGSVTCWIEGEESQSRLEIDGHWEAQMSLSSTATLRGSAESCRAAQVRCRSAKADEKFKILSLSSC